MTEMEIWLLRSDSNRPARRIRCYTFVSFFAEVFTAEPTLQARNRTPPRIKNGGINKMRIPLFNTAERAPCCAAAVR